MSEDAHDLVARMVGIVCVLLAASFMIQVFTIGRDETSAEVVGLAVTGGALVAGIGMLTTWNKQR